MIYMRSLEEIRRTAESPEQIDLETRIRMPWEYPREDNDYILYPSADDNLKADIAYELLPTGTIEKYNHENPYRHLVVVSVLLGPYDKRHYYADIADKAQRAYEAIRDNFKSIPILELAQDDNSIHEFSVAATVIENELVIEGFEVEIAKKIASAYWSYSHRLKYADSELYM